MLIITPTYARVIDDRRQESIAAAQIKFMSAMTPYPALTAAPTDITTGVRPNLRSAVGRLAAIASHWSTAEATS